MTCIIGESPVTFAIELAEIVLVRTCHKSMDDRSVGRHLHPLLECIGYDRSRHRWNLYLRLLFRPPADPEGIGSVLERPVFHLPLPGWLELESGSCIDPGHMAGIS